MTQQHHQNQQAFQPNPNFAQHLSEPGFGRWSGAAFAGFSLFWTIVLASHQSFFIAQQQQFQASSEAERTELVGQANK